MLLARPRIFLVDTFGMIFRAFYGRAKSSAQDLRTASGIPTEAVYVFNNMFKKFLGQHQPEHVIAVWEGRGPTFREEIYPQYKENREEIPEDLVTQLPYIKRLLEAWNVQVVAEDGYEADDTIGLLAGQAAKQELDVWVVSSDKDLMQLVREGVTMLDPVKNKQIRRADVKKRLGVDPEHVADYLALCGDKVDNIPGAPRIGPKGAQQLIEAYGDVEAIIQHAGEVKRKMYRESLLTYGDQIRLSKRLASLDRSGTVSLDIEASRHRPPNNDRLLALYRTLEFNSLASQLEGDSAQSEAESQVSTFQTRDEFADWLAETDGPVAIALLDKGQRRKGGAAAAGIGLMASGGSAWHLPEHLIDCARQLVEFEDREVWVHDWKSAIHGLGTAGIKFPKAADDTMLMAFLVDSSRTNYSLEKTVERRLGTKWKPSAALAAIHTCTFHDRWDSEIDSMGLREIYATIELPLVPVLARMETAGILLDSGALGDLSIQLARDIDRLGDEIHALAGKTFKIGSPKQLSEVLYNDLNLPKPRRRGKSKILSTASDILKGLAPKHPIAQKVLDWRQFSKLKNTYVDVLPKLVKDDGRLHTTFNPTGSATGRLSSNNPNLQNIPRRKSLGREIRKAFVARPGWTLVAADYSQIELRVLAHMSQDPKLLEAFRSGDDIHARTAAEVLGIAPELVGPEERDRAKAVNFGIIYGLSPFGLAKQLGISRRSAGDYIKRYFERYSAIKVFIEETVAATKERGFSLTLFGRRRPMPGLASKAVPARQRAEREAVNSPIQGTAADLIKKAMVTIDAELANQGLRSLMLLQVHDELVFEVPEEEFEAVTELVRAEMEAAAELDVPLVADVKRGPNWRDLEAI